MATSGSHNTGSYDGRYYTFSWSATQSVTANTSTVTWTISCAGGNSSWYAERTLNLTIAGTTVYSKTSRVERYTGTIATGTITISHSSDGTGSFTYAMNVACYTSAVNLTCSGTDTLTTIARASSIAWASSSTKYAGTAYTITVTRYSTSFTHTITYSFGSASGTICTKSSSTSISWTIPLTLLNQIPSATYGTGSLTCTTYSGSTSIGTSTLTLTVYASSSIVPSVTLSVSDALGYADTYGGYVQNKSKVAWVATGSGTYSSTIKSYAITVDGTSYTSSSGTSSVLSNTGTRTIKATVTDSRGRTATTSTTITVLAYAKPSISSLSVHRCDDDGNEDISGEYGLVTVSGSVTSLSSLNTATWVLKYKKSSASSYTSATISTDLSVSSLSTLITADSDSSYDITITVTDSFGSSSSSVSLSTAFAIIHFGSSGKAIGFGKVVEEDRAEFGMEAEFEGGVTIKEDGEEMSLEEYIGSVVEGSYLDNAKFMIGSKVLTASSSSTSLAVFACTSDYSDDGSISTLTDLFGIDEDDEDATMPSGTNTMCIFSNGDGAAQSVHIDGATCKSKVWYATFAEAPSSGNIRINYFVGFWG